MCKVKNGKRYDKEAQKEMPKLEERGGFADRRGPDEPNNGSRFVTMVRFYVTLGSIIALFSTVAFPWVTQTNETTGKVEKIPSHTEMVKEFMPREALELRLDVYEEALSEMIDAQTETNTRLRAIEDYLKETR